MSARSRSLQHTEIPALDIGLEQLRDCRNNLRLALCDPHVRVETVLGWLFVELRGNSKALQTIRHVAEAVDAAIDSSANHNGAKVAQAAAVEQYVANILAGIASRARATR